MKLQRRIERSLRIAIRDELHCLEQSAAPDVADIRVVAEPDLQQLGKTGSGLLHAIEKALLANDLLDRQSGRATDRMGIIRLPMLERARPFSDRIVHGAAAYYRAYRLVTGGQSFTQSRDVRDHTVLLAREEGAGPG